MTSHNFPLAQWADKKAGRWILVYAVLIVLFLLGSSVAPQEDHGSEFIQSQQLEADQRTEAQQQSDIDRCKAERGPGVVPRFAADGSVIDCDKRRRS
jgi:hypothetical protein